MTTLAVNHITKQFGRFTALDDVTLQVAEGTFCVLLGPSGCGKSTLLNIIAGLIPQDGGRVYMDGLSVDHLTPRERDMAMVFQSYALYPHMTVAGNMGFGLKMRGTPRELIKERVREAALFLGIEDLLGRKPRELSGGQRQRVAMGRALVRRPRLFLFDEPLSNLDARLRASVRLELKRIHEHVKGTVVYVTHDQVEAMSLGTMVVVMQAGRIHQIGPPREIYQKPADRFVATFIGSPEMNLLKGTGIVRDGTALFRGPGYTLDMGGTRPDCFEDVTEIGIRPEDLDVLPPGSTPLEAVVELVTTIGAELYLNVLLGKESLTVRVPADCPLQKGDLLSLGLKAPRVHFFQHDRRVE